MTATLVTLILDEGAATDSLVTQGSCSIVPSVRFPDVPDRLIVGQVPVTRHFGPGGAPQVQLIANDTAGPQGVSLPGWNYTISYSGVPGSPASWSFNLLSTNGLTQRLSSLAQVPAAQPGAQYVPLPVTPPADNTEVLGLSSASPLVTQWVGGSGANRNPVAPPASPFWETSANEQGSTIGGLIFFNNGFQLEGGPAMTMWVEEPAGPFSWGVTAQMSTANGHVKAYPCAQFDTSIPAGNIYAVASWAEGGPAYPGSNYNGPIAGIDYETAWDIFTTGNAREIMIWTRNAGQVPAGAQIGTTAIGGVGYDVWQNSNNYLVYVAQVPFSQAEGFDVGLFIRDAIGRGFIAQTDDIIQICFGWEICQTNNTLSDFSMSGFSLNVGTAALARGVLASGITMPAYIAPAVVPLTDAATILVDASLGNDQRVTLGGNRAFGAPANAVDGESLTFWIAQPVSGGPYTPTFATGLAGYSFGAAGAPTWSVTAKAVDMVTFRYNARLGVWCYAESKLGYAAASSPVAAVRIGALASSGSPAFGQATTAGHLLVAWLASNSGSSSDPFGTVAPGWVEVPGGAAGGAFGWSSVFYKPNCSNSETAPVFTGAGSTIRAMLGEFSGVVPSSAIDSNGKATSGGSTVSPACAAADAIAGDLIVSAASWTGNGTATTVTVTMTDGTGATVTPVTTNDAGGNSPQMNVAFAYGIAGSAGASPDATVNTLGQFSASQAVIASFKAS